MTCILSTCMQAITQVSLTIVIQCDPCARELTCMVSLRLLLLKICQSYKCMWHIEFIKLSVSGFWKLHDWHRKRTWIEVVLIDAENDPGHTDSTWPAKTEWIKLLPVVGCQLLPVKPCGLTVKQSFVISLKPLWRCEKANQKQCKLPCVHFGVFPYPLS
jgi:hypothetical protein